MDALPSSRMSSPSPSRLGGRLTLIAILAAAGLMAGAGTHIRPGIAQNGQGEGRAEARRLLEQRRAQMYLTSNPWEMRDVVYRMQREQRALRLAEERDRLAGLHEQTRQENLARASRELQTGVESRQAPPDPRRELLERQQAASDLHAREMSTPQGRIRTYLQEFSLARMAQPQDDPAELHDRLARAFRSESARTSGVDPASRVGEPISQYINGTVGYAGEPDTALTFDVDGLVILFDRYGFPMPYSYDYVWSGSTDWSIWVGEADAYYVVLVAKAFALLYWDGTEGTSRGSDAVTVEVSTADVDSIDFRAPQGATMSGTLRDFHGEAITGATSSSTRTTAQRTGTGTSTRPGSRPTSTPTASTRSAVSSPAATTSSTRATTTPPGGTTRWTSGNGPARCPSPIG